MFKKITTLALAAIMALTLFAAPALAEGDDYVKTITVQGAKTLMVPADYATMNLGVTITAETVDKAQSENAEILTNVIAAIKALGIEDGDIITSSFNVYPQFDYQYGKLGETRVLTGYQVENMLQITVHDLDKVSSVLDAAMGAGANQSYGINFQSTKQSEVYDAALKAAVEDGARKAELLAKAGGKTLIELITLNESADMNYRVYETAKYAMDSAAGASTPIMAGEISVNATVTMVYTFK